MSELSEHTHQQMVDFVNTNSGLTVEQILKKCKTVNQGTIRGAVTECISNGKLSSRGWRPMRIFPAGQGDGHREEILGKRLKPNGHDHEPQSRSVDLLIVIPYGKDQTLTVTMTEAKQLRDLLVASLK